MSSKHQSGRHAAARDTLVPRLQLRRQGGRAAYYLGRPASQWIEALSGRRLGRRAGGASPSPAGS